MKALSLTQPWASLVAIGAKRVESRSWGTKYRGPLAIHAAKNFPIEARTLALTGAFAKALYEAGLAGSRAFDPPLGAVIATVNLVGCYRMGEMYSRNARELFARLKIPEHPEMEFGDYSAGRFAWVLEDVTRLEPVPAMGRLGLWEWAER